MAKDFFYSKTQVDNFFDALGWAVKTLTTQDLNSVDTPGRYLLIQSSYATPERNYPAAIASAVEVTQTGHNIIRQDVTPSAFKASQQSAGWRRYRYQGTWLPWTNMDPAQTPPARALSTESLDTLLTTQEWTQLQSSNATTDRGYPVKLAGTLSVTATDAGSIVWQVYRPWADTDSAQSAEYRRQFYLGSWRPWVSADARTILASTPPPLDVGTNEHMMRLNDLRSRIGAPRVTGGAVTIIADHGTTKFRDVMLPLLRKHGIRCTLALNAGRLEPSYTFADTESATWAEVQSWHDVDGIEIANHGQTHSNASSTEAITAEVRGGREALEAALPGVPIDTWVQTGIPKSGFGGFGTGDTLSAYYTTHAGRVILDSHALVTGGVPRRTGVSGCYHLDGHPVQGAHGLWIDVGVTESVNATVNAAVTRRMGTIIRIHPQYIGDPDKITAAQLDAFLGNLAARRDVGKLAILPYREWSLAVTTSTSTAITDNGDGTVDLMIGD